MACRYGWLGLWEFGWEFDSAAPPHDSTAQTLAPNEALLRRLGLQMTSFTQDGRGHTEMVKARRDTYGATGHAHISTA